MCLQLLSSLNTGGNLYSLKYLLTTIHHLILRIDVLLNNINLENIHLKLFHWIYFGNNVIFKYNQYLITKK